MKVDTKDPAMDLNKKECGSGCPLCKDLKRLDIPYHEIETTPGTSDHGGTSLVLSFGLERGAGL